MQRLNSALSLFIFALCLAPLTANDAFAEKPAWKESGKPHKQKEKFEHRSGKEKQYRRREEPTRQRRDVPPTETGGHFSVRHRDTIRDYYAEQFRSGRCPPGLAKKNNGCLPPGQAKRWSIGQPLPRDVIFYDLPPAIALAIGPAPAGYRYVRVASDILMIAVGTGMVMDAIQDLGGF
ncbi:MAG: hypothetical protein ACU85E_08435 [Gammaproteobacteria bacterium]